MPSLQDVASLADALAWPVVAILVLAVFNKSLRGWLKERPHKVKFGPVEAEWASAAAKAQVALETELPAITSQGLDHHPGQEASQFASAASVIRESAHLETILRRCSLDAGVDAEGDLTALARRALEASLIDERTASAVNGLATMRNLAVQAPQRITAEQASQFTELTRTTSSAIEARARVAKNLSSGTDNISHADIKILLEDSGSPAEIVRDALTSNSSVKQRQIATALIDLGEISAALDIACVIANRAEARSVGRTLVRHIANLPEEQRCEGLQQLARLRPRLGRPQRRDIREEAENLDVKLSLEWSEEITE